MGNENNLNNDQYESNEAEYKGHLVEFQKDKEDGSYRLQRVISTDPQVYLKKEFQPGSIIAYKDLIKKQEKF